MQTVEPDLRELEPERLDTNGNGHGPRDLDVPRTTTVGEVLRWVTAGLLAGAAGIHFAMMGEHAGVSWTHGTFFGVVAWVQLVLAVAIVRSRSRWVAGGVIVANLAVLTIWLLTRTVGIAIGGDGTPEDWGTTDIVCAALEGAAILACIGLLVPRFARRPLSAGVGWSGVAVVGILVAALVTFVFSPASADGAAGDGHNHGGGEEAAAPTAGGAAATPGDGHAHSHAPTALNGQKITGVKAQDIAAEAQPDKPLDAATRATLKSQLVAARDFALRYPTVADATAAGYYVAGGFAPGSGAHYIAPGGGLTMPGPFDPTKVNSLIYAGTDPTSEITGLMYFAIGDMPEGFAGPNDHWHRHSNVCIKGGAGKLDVPFPADADVTKKQCDEVGGSFMPVTGSMVHAWVVPSWESPQGVFSHDNTNIRCADGTYKTDKAGFCQGI
jgi:hypothetical protein